MRQKRKSFVSVGEVLRNTAKRLKLDEGLSLHRLWDGWEEIAGPQVAAHARPAKIVRGTLYVRVEHPTWMQELGFLKAQLTANIRRALPNISLRGIRFELGELPPLPPRLTKPTLPAARPLTPKESVFVDRTVGDIADGNLRDAARRAMIKGIARSRKGA